MQTDIDFTRWAIYFVFGAPFLAWVFFGRDNALKVLSAVGMLIFVQQSFAYRRYLGPIGIGPSIMTAYVVLVALFTQRRQVPNLGVVWLLWAGFLLAAVTGAVVGGLRGGSFERNVYDFQLLYLEGFIFFLVGSMAFTRDEELQNFLFYFVMAGLAVSLAHIFCLVTGYRFRDFSRFGEEVRRFNYGGFFDNANTQGSFFSMTIPMALLLLTGGRLGRLRRGLVLAAIVFMLGSLLQSVHRGGILTTGLLSILIIWLTARRPAMAASLVLAGLVGVLASYFLLTTLLPDFAAASIDFAKEKGLQSPRFVIWPRFIQMVLDNPLGIGLSVDNLLRARRPYAIPLSSTHDLYLAILVQIGFAGLLFFLSLTGAILYRNFRAWRVVRDPSRRVLLLAVMMPLLGFFLVGVTESVWENGIKINQLFWFWCGISIATSTRMLAERRAAVRRIPQPGELEGSPAFGR